MQSDDKATRAALACLIEATAALNRQVQNSRSRPLAGRRVTRTDDNLPAPARSMIAARAARQTGILCAATLAALLLAIVPVFATCTGPAGNAGDIIYSSINTMMAYCNGTGWIAMGVSSAVNFGTLTTNDFCTATSGTAIACTTGSTGTGSVVLSASPTLTGTVTGATSTGRAAISHRHEKRRQPAGAHE